MYARTQGTWEVTQSGFVSNDGAVPVIARGASADGDDKRICMVDLQREDVKRGDKWKAEDQERDANARLISSAPDLKAACIKLLNGEISDAMELARASIAKANGVENV